MIKNGKPSDILKNKNHKQQQWCEHVMDSHVHIWIHMKKRKTNTEH